MNQKRCLQCGSATSADAKLCPSCGSQVFSNQEEADLMSATSTVTTNAPTTPLSSAPVRCPSCGKTVLVSSASTHASCGNCGNIFDTQSALQLFQLSQMQQSAGYQQVITPFLARWKTSVGATIGGCAVYFILYLLLEVLVAVVRPNGGSSTGVLLIILLLCIIYSILGIWYAASFFPALFKRDNTSSPATVSFLNGLFGNVLFGCLWNHALTKKQKGASNIVYIVLMAASIVLLASSMLFALSL